MMHRCPLSWAFHKRKFPQPCTSSARHHGFLLWVGLRVHTSRYVVVDTVQRLSNIAPALPSALCQSATCPGAPNPSYALTAASGWSARAVLGRLTMPRGLAMDTAGHLIVSERGKGITGHVLDASGCVTSSKTIVQGNGPNHAVEFNPAGDKLYARYAGHMIVSSSCSHPMQQFKRYCLGLGL